MKIIIDISEDTYHDAKAGAEDGIEEWEAMRAIANGTPISESEDCVSFEAVKNTIRMVQRTAFISDNEFMRTMKLLKSLPPVTPKQKVGQWSRELIRNEHGGCIGAKMICSECGRDNGYDKRMKFCPNCGAKMREDGEQNE